MTSQNQDVLEAGQAILSHNIRFSFLGTVQGKCPSTFDFDYAIIYISHKGTGFK